MSEDKIKWDPIKSPEDDPLVQHIDYLRRKMVESSGLPPEAFGMQSQKKAHQMMAPILAQINETQKMDLERRMWEATTPVIKIAQENKVPKCELCNDTGLRPIDSNCVAECECLKKTRTC